MQHRIVRWFTVGYRSMFIGAIQKNWVCTWYRDEMHTSIWLRRLLQIARLSFWYWWTNYIPFNHSCGERVHSKFWTSRHEPPSRWFAVAEWLACGFLDLQIAGSNPSGATLRAGGRVVTHSPLTPTAQVQLPDVALSRMTHPSIPLGSVNGAPSLCWGLKVFIQPWGDE